MRYRFSLVVSALCAAMLSTAAHGHSLAEAGVGSRITLPAFSYAEGKAFSAPITLQRIDIYAPGSQLLVSTEKGWREIPRSRHHVFTSDPGATATRMYLVYDPDTGGIEGGIFDEEGLLAITGRAAADGSVTIDGSKRMDHDAHALDCDGDHAIDPIRLGAGTPENGSAADAMAAATVTSAAAQQKGATLHSAVVAIDTDNELMQLRFAGDTQTATTYFVNLFAGLNVIYERDLGVRLLQGTTRLRVAADSYTTTSASSTFEQLLEVSEFWRVNEAAINRAFVMQVSGKAANPGISNGLAWVLNGQNGDRAPNAGSGFPDGFYDNTWCLAKGFRFDTRTANPQTIGHFSVSRVQLPPVVSGTDAASAVLITAHELGHNFGARHTNCTAADGSNPLTNVSSGTIDTCLNTEGNGCYAGPSSCPTAPNLFAGTGSLMSRCSNACGVNATAQFDPTHEAFLDTRVASNITSGCLVEVVSSDVGPTVSPTSPANGSSTSLGGGTVGTVVSGNITFSVSGGNGAGTTALSCTAAGAATIFSGSPQNAIAVNGTANNVVVRMTVAAAAQQGTVSCTATPQGGTAANFSFTFTTSAGAVACTGDCVFRNGFE